jgi:hypothetical protein
MLETPPHGNEPEATLRQDLLKAITDHQEGSRG